MNILTDRLPNTIKVGAVNFDIVTDFRAGVNFSLLIEKGEDNIFNLCKPFLPNGLPRNVVGAVEAVLWFYRGGEETKGDSGGGSDKPSYSFEVDSEAIYADFWRYYSIDLAREELHWWTFRSLLFGLPEDSNFKNRIYYRTCNLKDLPKKEKQRIAKIRKQIEIKTAEKGGKLTLEQRNKQMLDYVTKRFNETRG